MTTIVESFGRESEAEQALGKLSDVQQIWTFSASTAYSQAPLATGRNPS
jgi:hypothetical protein